jgi:hypothetical protein
MANERIPNDPYRSQNDPYRPSLAGDDLRDPARLDNELQLDPELQEGPTSTGKIALFAVAIALVLGAVFYGLNNSTIDHAGTAPPAQTAQQTRPASPTAPPGLNKQPGTTTGSATNQLTPPASNPTGTEVDRSANSPTK